MQKGEPHLSTQKALESDNRTALQENCFDYECDWPEHFAKLIQQAFDPTATEEYQAELAQLLQTTTQLKAYTIQLTENPDEKPAIQKMESLRTEYEGIAKNTLKKIDLLLQYKAKPHMQRILQDLTRQHRTMLAWYIRLSDLLNNESTQEIEQSNHVVVS